MATLANSRFERVSTVLRKVNVKLGVWDFDPLALFHKFLAVFLVVVFYRYYYCPRFHVDVVRSIVTNFEVLLAFDGFQRSFLFAS